MSKRLARSSKNLLTNTIKMVTFTNRKKEENQMWRKYTQIKKRKLQESDSSSESDTSNQDAQPSNESLCTSKRPLSYRNKCFKEADESFSAAPPDDSNREEETDPKPEVSAMDQSWRANFSACHLNQSGMSDDLNQSCASSAVECMVDASFSYGDGKCLIVSAESTKKEESNKQKDQNNNKQLNANGFKGYDDKIRKREKTLSKLIESKTPKKNKSKKAKKDKKEKKSRK
jgi:hypothetical protein